MKHIDIWEGSITRSLSLAQFKTVKTLCGKRTTISNVTDKHYMSDCPHCRAQIESHLEQLRRFVSMYRPGEEAQKMAAVECIRKYKERHHL